MERLQRGSTGPVETKYVNSRAGDTKDSDFGSEKANSQIGREPKFGFFDSLSDYVSKLQRGEQI
ncbi:hypothetical protein HF072_09405 [Bacillus sp. RO3]|nr:hypothetical protein [Bacillus sp. RO3]